MQKRVKQANEFYWKYHRGTIIEAPYGLFGIVAELHEQGIFLAKVGLMYPNGNVKFFIN